MNLLFIFLANFGGGLFALPIIFTGVSVYCWFRYAKNKSHIALGVGILFGLLAMASFLAMLLDK